MSHTERDCYLSLLIYQWQNGAIPSDPILRMQLCQISDVGQWERIWRTIEEKFEVLGDCGSRGNLRMHEDREQAIERWQKNRSISKKRKAAAKQRWCKSNANAYANACANRMQNDASVEGGSNSETPLGVNAIKHSGALSEKSQEALVKWCQWRAMRTHVKNLDPITVETIAYSFAQAESDKGPDHVVDCVQNAIERDCRNNVPWWDLIKKAQPGESVRMPEDF